MKINKKVGISSYGAYIPSYRIKTEEIALVYNKDAQQIINGLGISEKAVKAIDEDTVTMGVNALEQALIRAEINNKDIRQSIGAVYTGSESHPYAVKSSSAIIAEACNLNHNYTAADLEFACKAGTAGLQMVLGLVSSGMIKNGIAIGADAAQGAPGDALEYSAASAAAAFIVSEESTIADIEYTTSFTTDTPDFWRREHQKYPSHGGRFTGDPAYFKHITSSTNAILEESKTKLSEFDHIVFHMPNGKFPVAVSKMIGVTEEQLKYSLTVKTLGNSYSACSLVGLVNVLDNAKPDDKILLVSYGSGSGSDAFVINVNKNITEFHSKRSKLGFDKTLQEMISKKTYLNYGKYIIHTGKIG